ncbi:MAG TPA: response regulator, partial [Nitrososphaera sp.]|nr:response regulator [Nitrososphaera sp.]
MKILVIDDSPDITDLLVKVLTAVGHDVSSSGSGREGLALINSGHFDAVFLDIAMPDFSGLDVINELVKEGKLKDR